MNDPQVTDDQADGQNVWDARTESKPLHETLMPKTSIRFLLILIGISALVMVVFRAAGEGFYAARIATLLIMTVAGCFAIYAALFLIANLFSSATAPIVQVLESTSSSRQPMTESAVDANTDNQEKT